MAVAHDGEANVVVGDASSGATFTATGKTTAGSDRYGVAAIYCSADNVTGVLWGLSAMTQLGKVVNGTDGRTAYLYGIEAPPTGATDVVAALVPDAKGSIIVSSYNGCANQAGQTATAVTATGTATPATVNDASGASGDMVVDSLAFLGAGTPPAAGAGQTGMGTPDDGIAFGSSSYEAGPTPTMSYTLTSSTRWSIVAFALKQSAAAGAVRHNMSLLGVG